MLVTKPCLQLQMMHCITHHDYNVNCLILLHIHLIFIYAGTISRHKLKIHVKVTWRVSENVCLWGCSCLQERLCFCFLLDIRADHEGWWTDLTFHPRSPAKLRESERLPVCRSRPRLILSPWSDPIFPLSIAPSIHPLTPPSFPLLSSLHWPPKSPFLHFSSPHPPCVFSVFFLFPPTLLLFFHLQLQ